MAVNSLGYNHAVVKKTIQEQLKTGITHLSGSQIHLYKNKLSQLLSKESNKGDVSVGELRERMQKTVQKRFGVYRESETLKLGNDELASMSQDLKHIKVKDQSDVFNTDLVEALELHNLMQVAGSVGVSAEQRTESRGAHAREDFPDRDDENWLKHTLFWGDVTDYKVTHRPVRMTTLSNQISVIQPQVRVY